MIRSLVEGLGIPAEVLLRKAGGKLDPNSPALQARRFPIAQMLKRGWFPGFNGTLAEAKEQLEDLIASFVGTIGVGISVIIVTNGFSKQVQIIVNSKPVSIHFSNHFTLLRKLLSIADACLLVSPFLYENFSPLVQNLNLNELSIELISTCAPKGEDQLQKPFALRSFGREFNAATGNWPTIGLDQSLHSKIYLFSVADKPFAGVVTSANLTMSGLVRNHETGILITAEKELIELGEIARSGLDYVSLSEYQIEKLCSVVELAEPNRKFKGDREIGLTAILNLYGTPSGGNRSTKLRDNAKYFIKISGVKDEPILPVDRKPFNVPHGQLAFAKRPVNINLGDCLLEVAVGGKCFLSYYSCASAVYERTDEEKRNDPNHKRWPFYIYANNLSLHYGAVWFDKPIYYDAVVKEFKTTQPKVHVTSAGKDAFVGAMQMGHSYIPVTKAFGEFVRQRIDAFPAST
jgi:hypothetical protein